MPTVPKCPDALTKFIVEFGPYLRPRLKSMEQVVLQQKYLPDCAAGTLGPKNYVCNNLEDADGTADH